MESAMFYREEEKNELSHGFFGGWMWLQHGEEVEVLFSVAGVIQCQTMTV